MKSMNKYMMICAMASFSLLSGCSSTSSSQGTEVAQEKSELVCEVVAKTGSHMKKRRCVSKAQARLERERAQEELRRNQLGGGKTDKTTL